MGGARTSGAAIASLIFGIVGCLQITALIAIVLGFVGIGSASKPGVSGKGLAIGGIVLGILWLILGAGGIYFTYWGVGKFKQMAGDAARPFITAIAQGDMATANRYTTLTEEEVGELKQQMADWGDVTNVQMHLSGIDAKNVNGRNTIKMRGTATFSKAGAKEFSVDLDDAGGGQLKVTDISFD
jgi:hypothetical protein